MGIYPHDLRPIGSLWEYTHASCVLLVRQRAVALVGGRELLRAGAQHAAVRAALRPVSAPRVPRKPRREAPRLQALRPEPLPPRAGAPREYLHDVVH
eukprot:869115-Pyramimonas_sp.AAC.1